MAFYFKPWTHWHEVPQETYNTLKRLSYGKEHLREDNLAKRGTLNVVAAFGGSNTFPGAESASMVEVQQRGRKGYFRVVYGLRVKDGLTYAEAAREFGECVFHLQACEGVLGNEGP